MDGAERREDRRPSARAKDEAVTMAECCLVMMERKQMYSDGRSRSKGLGID